MPELPEVETIVRGLARSLPGRRIDRVEVVHPDLIGGESADDFAVSLRGARIEGVARRAKNIVISLGPQRLVINLGMTGRLLTLDGTDPAPSHPGVRFQLDDGSLLVYHDVRRFGRLERLAADAWVMRDQALGLEPLDAAFTPTRLHEIASSSSVAIKTWLMDQRKIVGIGNIYASEALFRARLRPDRPARSLSRRAAARLHAAIQEVLREAIDFRGTTLLDYRDGEGRPGEFASRLRVYARAGEPCPRCDKPISRVVQGGRSTFFCPRCQR